MNDPLVELICICGLHFITTREHPDAFCFSCHLDHRAVIEKRRAGNELYTYSHNGDWRNKRRERRLLRNSRKALNAGV